MFICVCGVTYVQIELNHWKLRNFAISRKMDKNTMKLYRRFFLLNKKNAKKTGGELFCTLGGMTSLTLNPNIYNFITYWNLIKTPRNFVQDSFSIKSTKTWQESSGEVFRSHFPFKVPLHTYLYNSLIILRQTFFKIIVLLYKLSDFWGNNCRT